MAEDSTDRRPVLVVATTNRGKLRELRALLAGVPIDVEALADRADVPIDVVEDGETFAANALKKARAAAAVTGMLSLADDSGLEVDVLGGRPGVRSARFAREGASDAENNAALLAALEPFRSAIGLPSTRDGGGFRARFRCVLSLVDPAASGDPHLVEGACEGAIVSSPRGSNGFGYDPLFLVDGTGRTMAELDAAEKNRVSHRARAFEALRPLVERIAASGRMLDGGGASR